MIGVEQTNVRCLRVEKEAVELKIDWIADKTVIGWCELVNDGGQCELLWLMTRYCALVVKYAALLLDEQRRLAVSS